jgi:hypothetical protein
VGTFFRPSLIVASVLIFVFLGVSASRAAAPIDLFRIADATDATRIAQVDAVGAVKMGGTVSVANLPAVQAVTGSVGINPGSNTVHLDASSTVAITNLPTDASGNLRVSGSPNNRTVVVFQNVVLVSRQNGAPSSWLYAADCKEVWLYTAVDAGNASVLPLIQTSPDGLNASTSPRSSGNETSSGPGRIDHFWFNAGTSSGFPLIPLVAPYIRFHYFNNDLVDNVLLNATMLCVM